MRRWRFYSKTMLFTADSCWSMLYLLMVKAAHGGFYYARLALPCATRFPAIQPIPNARRSRRGNPIACINPVRADNPTLPQRDRHTHLPPPILHRDGRSLPVLIYVFCRRRRSDPPRDPHVATHAFHALRRKCGTPAHTGSSQARNDAHHATHRSARNGNGTNRAVWFPFCRICYRFVCTRHPPTPSDAPYHVALRIGCSGIG